MLKNNLLQRYELFSQGTHFLTPLNPSFQYSNGSKQMGDMAGSFELFRSFSGTPEIRLV